MYKLDNDMIYIGCSWFAICSSKFSAIDNAKLSRKAKSNCIADNNLILVRALEKCTTLFMGVIIEVLILRLDGSFLAPRVDIVMNRGALA